MPHLVPRAIIWPLTHLNYHFFKKTVLILKNYSLSIMGLTLVACAPTTHTTPYAKTPPIPSSIIKLGNTPTNNSLSRQHPSNSSAWVFIEGDGTPWVLGRWPAQRPIVKKPVAYPLWQNTQATALYLKRPCYFDNTSLKPSDFSSVKTLPNHCTANWWTTDIYSQGVIRALKAELENALQQHAISHYILIGHSGGGTLATLLADNMLHKPLLIITLAGNLKPIQFNHIHQLPKSTLTLPLLNIPQWHYFAHQDDVISYSAQNICHIQTHVHCYNLTDTRHSDGWLMHWPAIKKKIQYFIDSQ